MKSIREVSVVALLAATLSACGGGGSSSAAAPASTQAASTTSTTGTTSTDPTSSTGTPESGTTPGTQVDTTTQTAQQKPADPIAPACVNVADIRYGGWNGTPVALRAGSATLQFTMYGSRRPALRLCLSVATAPIEGGGWINLTETYEFKVSQLGTDTYNPADFSDMSLTLVYNTSQLPANTALSAVNESSINAYYADANGSVYGAPTIGHDFSNPSLQVTGARGKFEIGSWISTDTGFFSTVSEGRYVVAFSK